MYFYERFYALPDYHHPDKLEEMKRIVLTKEPKVMSTAIREMREEVEKLEWAVLVAPANCPYYAAKVEMKKLLVLFSGDS